MICSANQWTGFYMIGTSVMKELKEHVASTENLIGVSVELLDAFQNFYDDDDDDGDDDDDD